MQDAEMKATFEQYPEVMILDATHKTNDRDMPFYVALGIDGNGESQVIFCFLVHTDDEESVRNMFKVFKEKNPCWNRVQVALTDKDMVERNVIKEELPNAELQLCLFHVLQTFGREVTMEKMGITAGERNTLLEHLKTITYCDSEHNYDKQYSDLYAIMPQNVLDYYNKNWHCIRHQWVNCFKNQHMHLQNRTTNRVESFFGSLKQSVTHRCTIQNLIKQFMSLLSMLRIERRNKYASKTFKVPTTNLACPVLRAYQNMMTPYSFAFLKEQFNLSDKYVVVDETTILGKGPHAIVHFSSQWVYHVGIYLPLDSFVEKNYTQKALLTNVGKISISVI